MSHGLLQDTNSFTSRAASVGSAVDALLKAFVFAACFADTAAGTERKFLIFSELGFYVAAPTALLIMLCHILTARSLAAAATPVTTNTSTPAGVDSEAGASATHLLGDASDHAPSTTAAATSTAVALTSAQKIMLLGAWGEKGMSLAALPAFAMALLLRHAGDPAINLSPNSSIGVFAALSLMATVSTYSDFRTLLATMRRRPTAATADFFTRLSTVAQVLNAFTLAAFLTACVADAFAKTDVDTFLGISRLGFYAAGPIALFTTLCEYLCRLITPTTLLTTPALVATNVAGEETAGTGISSAAYDLRPHLNAGSPFPPLSSPAAPAASRAPAIVTPFVVFARPRPLTIGQVVAAYGAWYNDSARYAAVPAFIMALLFRGATGSAPIADLPQGAFIGALIALALITGAMTRQYFTERREIMRHNNSSTAIAFTTSGSGTSEGGLYTAMGAQSTPLGSGVDYRTLNQ